MTEEKNKKGKVYLVGAGPGEPDLITIRGMQLIGLADCIIYDKLVNPSLLDFAKGDAEIIHTPKRQAPNSFTQEQINEVMVEKAMEGKTVVRLKGGDPWIFSRGPEEAKILAQAGIDFEIVPGITAGLAAAEYAGIMLSERSLSSQVIFITGQEAAGKQQSSIDWDLLAKFRGTLVFYMGVTSLEMIVDRLIENGLDAAMPAAVVANATLPTQIVIKSKLGELFKKCNEQNIEPPAIIFIGKAVGGDSDFKWFMKKPLFGKNIVLTRDSRGNAEFADKIIRAGGNPISFETFRLHPLTGSNEFLETLASLAEYDWIIFTSANGVDIFFECLRDLKKDARIFGHSKIAAVGAATKEKLACYGIRADFVPDVYTSKQLAVQLLGFTSLRDRKILLLRSELADDDLDKVLKEGGARIHRHDVYTAVSAQTDPKFLMEKLENKKVDCITFASPSSVKFFFEKLPLPLVASSGAKIASIGPATSEALKEVGVKIDIEADIHTIDGLLDAIESAYKKIALY